ncbi:hypothetical protein TRICI_006832 [Trichomonascus ciferrii]|uniref:TAFII55 protein conserved region domain-containing protein n=1 Tax=Trichomonascus ciferrii TaxID=44093 RepID=A0A642UCL6_9ASCO|nr:hypothetical protein TRICI_006832 [Trichomonascus ciferrii]
MIKLKLNPEDKKKDSGSAETPPPKKKEKRKRNSGVPKISLNLNEGPKPVPRIRVKAGRQPGDGYDSEAPDREEDPMIQEAIVLRMVPGEHLDYLREACDQGDLTGVNIKFKDSRNAVVSIHDQLFAAKLVDLPTVTEVHKTFDRKNIYKGADVCQMLLVTEPIEYEDEVFNIKDAPQSVYPHGLTPPLNNVRKRRFRKRISNKIIETVEAKVNDLFRLDEEAEESHYELLTPQQLAASNAAPTASGGQGGSSSAEPTTPYDMLGSQATSPQVETPGDEEEEEDEMLGELEKALEGEDEDDEEEDDEDDEEDEKSDGEGEGEGGMDEEELEKAKHRSIIKEEIADLEGIIADKEQKAASTVNQILRGRQQDVINKLKGELEMKRRQANAESNKDENEIRQKERDQEEVQRRAQEEEDEEEEEEEEEDDDDDVESLF